MHRYISVIGSALLLAACSQSPTQSGQVGSTRVQLLSVPSQVGAVTLEVHGDDAATAPDSKTYDLTVQGGAASLNLTGIVKGHYTLTARGYDGADKAVVLYKASVALTIQDDTPISLKMNRATSAITVNATGVNAKSNVLVAKVGGLQARLLANGSAASGTLQGVPTGRGLNVLVEGRDADGTLRQQGSATLDLSESDQAVSVALSDVQAAAPSLAALSGPQSVKKGESYSLRVQGSAGGSEVLKTLKIEWGDGSSDSYQLSGASLDASYSHTYSAAGPQQVSATLTNGAGLSAVGSTGVTVQDTASPVVTVDVGAEVVPVNLTATGIPAGTERVQAVVDAPLAARSLRRQDLKAEYLLELVPNPDGTWSGALGLPAGFSYSASLRVTGGGQTASGAAQTITTAAGGANSFTLAYAPGGTASCPAGTITTIGAVQGSTDTSPLVGQTVTVRGVVTLDAQAGLKGFYLQDATPDADPATSDGVFVYTASAPQTLRAGDLVQLSGRVQEYGGLTELDTVQNFVDCGAGTLPKATVLTFPLTSKADLEHVEGMLVSIPDILTVTDNYGLGRYGELGLASGGRVFNKTNGNGSSVDDSLRTIYLDDLASAQNPNPIPDLSAALTRRTGDTVAGLTGVVTYGGSTTAPNFRIEPTVTPVFTDANPRPAAPNPVGGSLRVGGANVLNYFTTLNPSYSNADGSPRGANSAFELARQQTKIVNALSGLNADVLALSEVENDEGNTALNTLVAALNARQGAGTYAAVQTGKIGTDAIRVAIVYRPARVQPVGSFVVNDNADGTDNRPPLAQTFRDLGSQGVFTVIANHLKSKGSCPTSGDTDQGQGCWNGLRVKQATKLLAFVGAMQSRSGDPDVLLMGDFNSYGAEDPIGALTGGGFVSENLRIPAADRYSYQFSGAFGYLDHALASAHLDSQLTGITEWHINSDEPTNADYNVEYKNIPQCVTGTPSGNTCLGQDLWQDNQFRASDHDPVLVGLNLSADGATPAPALGVSASGPATATVNTPYAITLSASGSPDSLRVNWGDGSADEALATTATGASHSYAAAGSFSVTVTASKGADSKTASVPVNVQPAPTGAATAWINELHYDNAGTDVGEFVEVVVPAGVDPTNLKLVLYNGNPAIRAPYGTITGYSLTLGATVNGYRFYTLSLPSNGLQNGGTDTAPEPDGLALCDGATLVEFLSYEGQFTANGGCANGQTSTDIFVSEDGTDLPGNSLQINGIGGARWTGPSIASPGNQNSGQILR